MGAASRRSNSPAAPPRRNLHGRHHAPTASRAVLPGAGTSCTRPDYTDAALHLLQLKACRHTPPRCFSHLQSCVAASHLVEHRHNRSAHSTPLRSACIAPGWSTFYSTCIFFATLPSDRPRSAIVGRVYSNSASLPFPFSSCSAAVYQVSLSR